MVRFDYPFVKMNSLIMKNSKLSRTTHKRIKWSSRFAFIMATSGAAVGLGNIWKFPYMAGQNGGGAFVLLYLLCILLIGMPTMIAELLIGRRGQRNAINALATLAQESGRSPAWQLMGWLGVLALVMVLSFYSVVSGWSIFYFFQAVKGTFLHASPESILKVWDNLLASPVTLIVWHTLFMLLTLSVVALGIIKGIEKLSKWMMPALFLVLITLVFYAAIEGDMPQALHYLFSFKLEAITSRTIIDAMGQAFFSLATGAGCILIYGSYLSKKTDLVNTVLVISLLDVIVALLAGLAIFPIVFSHQLLPESGPGLMFHVLPIAFSNMPGAFLVGPAFFILLIFAAWTSSISMAEPLVALLQERWNISRLKGAFCVGIVAWSFGLCSVFSFNVWNEVKLFHRFSIFQILTDLPTNILLPLGAISFCLFAGWIMKATFVKTEFQPQSNTVYALWRFAIRYIAPLGIAIVFFTSF